MSILKKSKKHIFQLKLKVTDNIIQDKSTNILAQFTGMYTFLEQMYNSLSMGKTESTV